MDAEFDSENVAFRIFKLFEREGLLREADPFTMKHLRERVRDILDYEISGLEDSYDVGREAGYAEGKDEGRFQGFDEAKKRLYAILEEWDND